MPSVVGQITKGAVFDKLVDAVHVAGTAHRLLYTGADGVVNELAYGTSGHHLKSEGASSAPTWEAPGGGEANTASSSGSGTSLYYQKTGVDLEFNAIKSENNRLSVSLDGATHDIELTVVEANIDHDALANFAANEHFTQASIDHTAIANIGTKTHAEIDTHIASDGSDHTFIDQDVRIAASPNFVQVGLKDTDLTPHYLKLAGPSVMTADRLLQFVPIDADRILTLSGNPTLGDWFDQSVKTGATPTFAGVVLTASLKIPSGSNPTVDAEGKLAWDSTDDQLVVYDGSVVRQIPSTFEVDRLIFAPSFVNDKIPLFHCDSETCPNGVKITKLSITLPADAAYSMPFEGWSGDPPAEDAVIETVTTTGTDSYMAVSGGDIDNPDLAAGDYIFLDIPSTQVDWIHVKVIGYRKGP